MGCHLAISTENEKTGKGSHVAMLLLLGNCHLVIYLKMKKREKGSHVAIVLLLGNGGVLSIIKFRKSSYPQCMPLILENFFQSIVFLYVFHGDGDRRRHISRTRPYYPYGIRILVHPRSDSSTKGNRGSFLSVPRDRRLDYRPLVVREFDLLPVHFNGDPKQCSVHYCSD